MRDGNKCIKYKMFLNIFEVVKNYLIELNQFNLSFFK